jgi:hypothetical protein
MEIDSRLMQFRTMIVAGLLTSGTIAAWMAFRKTSRKKNQRQAQAQQEAAVSVWESEGGAARAPHSRPENTDILTAP